MPIINMVFICLGSLCAINYIIRKDYMAAAWVLNAILWCIMEGMK